MGSGFRSIRIVLIVVLLWLLAVVSSVAETSRVTVKKTAVKKSPRVFSKTLEMRLYADQVEVLERAKGWVRIELDDDKSGWVRESHLSKPELSLQVGVQMVNVAASDEELTLAGKGFDRQVEKAYRQQNADADYTWIDRMESYRLDDVELNRFLTQGGLSPQSGDGHAQ